MAARLCPHCDVTTNFDHKWNMEGYWGRGQEKQQVNLNVWKCQNCDGLITVVQRVEGNGWVEWLIYPRSIPTLDDAVPKPVQADYIEGVECIGIGANKAAATMFRRSLQQVMINKRALEGKRLIDQIKSLVIDDVLPEEIGEWATEIRLWGNEGAHPSTDGLDAITGEDADEIRGFLDRIFEWVYIMPAIISNSRAKRDTKKQAGDEVE